MRDHQLLARPRRDDGQAAEACARPHIRCRTARRSAARWKRVGGLRTSLLLIDNKGMAFNLDRHVIVQGGKAIFNVPISLGAVDQAAGKAVPQIIVAVTGDVDLKSAEFPKPTAGERRAAQDPRGNPGERTGVRSDGEIFPAWRIASRLMQRVILIQAHLDAAVDRIIRDWRCAGGFHPCRRRRSATTRCRLTTGRQSPTALGVAKALHCKPRSPMHPCALRRRR